MLAPVMEADFGEEPLVRVNLAARERWPAFAAELEERTGLPTGYRESGALVVATDRDDAEALRRLHDFQLLARASTRSGWRRARCRRLEPGLSPRIAGGILAPGDAQADPRATVRALAAAVDEVELGVEVEAIEHDRGRVTGVRTAAGRGGVRRGGGGRGRVEPRARAHGRRSAGAPRQGPDPRAARARRDGRAVHTVVRTPRCYLVARGDGRVVLGATMEEQGFDTAVTADGVYRLLEAAWEVLPEVGELELVRGRRRAATGHARQRARSSAPASSTGLVWATGHWRNGVLLAPLTGEAVAELLAGGAPPEELARLDPGRFERAEVRA